ncbi:MAG: InlB B-repeat-containing protein [Lachnospiraceae bacterium]|nr:InlB B-repeat-containing protein [Lachnospiraceae bacterium]
MRKMKNTALKLFGGLATAAVVLAAAAVPAFGLGNTVSADPEPEQEVVKYDVWLGSTQVTSENQDDIFGDGKAKLIPKIDKETGEIRNFSLILDNPTIEGVHQIDDDTDCKIYYDCDNGCPSIYGCYHMDLAEADYGLYVPEGCWIYGDYSFIGEEIGVYSLYSWLHINDNHYNPVSGQAEEASFYAEGGTYGISIDREEQGTYSQTYFTDRLSRVEVKGGTEAIGNGTIRAESHLTVKDPEDAQIIGGNVVVIEGDEGKAVEVDHFVLERVSELWVGGIQVTEENKDDILEDGGKAKFDFDTNVLTLKDPVIDGFYEITKESTATIYAVNMDLTIKGSCEINSPNVTYGIGVYQGTLSLDGEFSVITDYHAIVLDSHQNFMGSDLYIEGGSLYAESRWSAVYGDSDIVIGNKVRRVECIATEPDEYNYAMGVTGVVKDDNGECVHKIIVDPSLVLVTPEDGVIDHNLIYEADQETFAVHVVFEHPCTVSFDTDEVGTAPEAQNVQYGDKIQKPEDPEAEGYVFKGWFADEDCTKEFDFDAPIESNEVTIYAKWAELFDVVFVMNGRGTQPADQIVEEGNKAEKPADPAAEGYVFKGWFADEDCTKEFDFDSAITADTKVYAKWAEVFTVKVDGQDGEKTVVEGEKIEKPADPTKDGYVFKGWFADEDCTKEFDFDQPAEGDTTIYPKWAKICKMTLNLGGGTLNGQSGSVVLDAEEGSTIIMPLPEKEGFEFDYWRGSSYKAGDPYTVSGDHNFRAMWKAVAGAGTGAPATGTNTMTAVMILVSAMMLAGLGLVIGKGRARRV